VPVKQRFCPLGEFIRWVHLSAAHRLTAAAAGYNRWCALTLNWAAVLSQSLNAYHWWQVVLAAAVSCVLRPSINQDDVILQHCTSHCADLLHKDGRTDAAHIV
jgi:hypothetical protein